MLTFLLTHSLPLHNFSCFEKVRPKSPTNGFSGLLEDVTAVTVTAGQVVSSVHLRALIPNGLISGYLWNDYCLTGENGQPTAGNCVGDDNGFYHADGMIQPAKSYIAGVALSLRPDSCTSNSAGCTAVTRPLASISALLFSVTAVAGRQRPLNQAPSSLPNGASTAGIRVW
jgi:hypothetical protein